VTRSARNGTPWRTVVFGALALAAVSLLLPATYSLDPTPAFIMFAGIYYGGMYGGSTTSILLNTPGESASVMTAVEGQLMARAGRGGAALATAAIGSFVAGTLATVALTVSAPVMVELALGFGPAEYFALAVLAFVAVSAVRVDQVHYKVQVPAHGTLEGDLPAAQDGTVSGTIAEVPAAQGVLISLSAMTRGKICSGVGIAWASCCCGVACTTRAAIGRARTDSGSRG